MVTKTPQGGLFPSMPPPPLEKGDRRETDAETKGETKGETKEETDGGGGSMRVGWGGGG